MEILQEQMIGHFSSNFQKVLKEFAIKHFPQDICQAKKQVDAFVISQSKKICLVGLELTVPIVKRESLFGMRKKQENMRR